MRTIAAGLLTPLRALRLAVMSLLGSLILMIVWLLAFAFIALGLGALVIPTVTTLVRRYTADRRRLARDWCGLRTDAPYRPVPELHVGVVGLVQHTRWIVRDPATWRDLLWLFLDATVGYIVATFAMVLSLFGVYGLVLAGGLWRTFYGYSHNATWYSFVHITGDSTVMVAAVTAVGYLALGIWLSPKLVRLDCLLASRLLGPMQPESSPEPNGPAGAIPVNGVDPSAAEVRRIERDLHDGAQARLVAVGMNLGRIEHLMDENPDRARELVADTRDASVKALHELRDLVRGIHPPVLSERGLGDAVRALGLDSPLDVDVEVQLPGRPVAPVESAAYFAVSEALTTAATHAGAQHVQVELSHVDGRLQISVTDDGRGGARLGDGLRGVQRRLAAFDGVLDLDSPPGGPTRLTMEIPCALSSQKTSSS